VAGEALLAAGGAGALPLGGELPGAAGAAWLVGWETAGSVPSKATAPSGRARRNTVTAEP
jgi:hypothetical protein